jgi:hypothetical protein
MDRSDRRAQAILILVAAVFIPVFALYGGFAALAWWCKPSLPAVGEPRISSR